MDRPAIAICSVSDKRRLSEFTRELSQLGVALYCSDGTRTFLSDQNIPAFRIQDVTGCPEILGGRLKTLHPAIYAGLLCRVNKKNDMKEMEEFNYKVYDIVICNLYPFEQTVQKECTLAEAIEKIDIGGVTLLRAAAKNYERLTVLCDPEDYSLVMDELKAYRSVRLHIRERLAMKAFLHTAAYDETISDHLRKRVSNTSLNISPNAPLFQIALRYGMNPHQIPAQIYNKHGKIPFKVLNGDPSYINMCDALNAWQLVMELKASTGLKAATSFKHVSPAGAAIATPFTGNEAQLCMVDDLVPLSDMAIAYARARGADRMSSYGDFIALSDECDVHTAKIISREVSDGIIAPSYSYEALNVLKKKKNGGYCVLSMDVNYKPSQSRESRTIYGLTLEQPRNNVKIEDYLFVQLATRDKSQLPNDAVRDLLVAAITVKYTQSNSVCYAVNGQAIGIGAGQQSRIHCTRLAGDKADNWWMRQHPKVLGMKFKKGVKRAEMINAMDEYMIQGVVQRADKIFQENPEILTAADRADWLSKMDGVSLASDAFFPFRDNIDRASRSGVKFIVCPSGSTNDESVIEACNELGIRMCEMSTRLFHH